MTATARPESTPDVALAGRRILFIGGGNMASAMISGLVEGGVGGDRIDVIEPAETGRATLTSRHGVTAWAGAHELPADRGFDAIVVAVKPQMAAVALAACRPLVTRLPGAVLVSIAAGTTIASLGAMTGGHRRIVRAMPNTPALIGAGISGLYAPPGTDPADQDLARAVLASTGAVVEVGTEALIDTVTAVSGSGPAYAFYLMEAMIAGGIAGGLDADTSRRLALETIRGAALLALASDEAPEVLRKRVTSPAGTTAAAIAVLDARGVDAALRDAVGAAAARSRELSAPAG